MKDSAHLKNNYRYFREFTTRWNDNDHYGHMNNSHYYAYFDSTIGQYLMNECNLSIKKDQVVGYVVHSQCNYVNSVAYPDELIVGLRVNKIGNSSVEYGLAIFKKGEEEASAHGTFTHVYVDRRVNQSTAIPEKVRSRLENLKV
ncbi:acyl-CoA thioesterase [Endozoicomonas arenosclerae]|uniref:acyl-CoA thioesterase n=1 Tax=Endozoicomonas arenosclerae TaxID=1633495 RepID=UPI0007845001|nr:thioesterase family protein [Endozoicomonas arenosclerae]